MLIRFIVMRGSCSLWAYVGIPNEHPLAGHSYKDLPIRAHGGLTFGSKGDGEKGKYRPRGFFWYGWDYSHSGDYAFFYDKDPVFESIGDRRWLAEDVIEDSWGAIYDFKKLMRLTETTKEVTNETNE